jgi:TRAP-type C4-dicarboxylate transport system permease large subunit
MVMFIIVGAAVFGHFLAISNIPFILSDWVSTLPIPPMAIMGVIVLIYFIGGFFMDSMALIIVSIPIFFPIVQKFNFDPIWFGVIVVMVGEMGVITPPVGVNVFVIKGIAPRVPLQDIYIGILPFLGAIVLMTALLLIFPQIAIFVPNLLYP